MGRLSNPPDPLETLTGQGSRGAEHHPDVRSERLGEVTAAAESVAPEDTGQLSNPGQRPVQRRLSRSELDTLAARYEAGQSLREIAVVLGIHHRTVAAHLERLGIPRRVNQRKSGL